MSKVSFFAFGGMKPVISDKLLPENNATRAVNTDLITGNIRPYWQPELDLPLSKTGTIQTLFEIKEGIWLHWNEEVNVARIPIENNNLNRVAFTGTDQPRVTDSVLATQGGGTNYPEVSYALGVPVPDLILDINVSVTPPDGVQLNWDIAGTAEDAQGDRIARVYTYTFVNQFGEEGAPADPSQVAYTNQDECVELTNFAGAPTGPYLIENVRIYRSLGTGIGQTTYLLVDEVPFPVVEPYVDCKTDAELGEALPSATWSEPPTGLRGITAMANGMLAGFVDNTIYFSEPYQAHAWPEDYVRSVDFNVIGLASSGNMLFVMTEGYPYVIIGNHPEVLSINKLEKSQACTSSRSIVDMGAGAVYASSDGLIGINTSGAQLISEGVFDKRTWALINPDTVHGYFYKDKYFGFYEADPGVGAAVGLPDNGSFVFDPARGHVVFSDEVGTAGYFDQIDGKLYYVKESPNQVYAWDSDTTGNLTFIWQSRIIEAKRTNFTAARVQAKGYPLTFRLYVDGAVKREITVNSKRPFRLPSGFTERDWSLEVEGTEMVEGIFMADTMEELW